MKESSVHPSHPFFFSFFFFIFKGKTRLLAKILTLILIAAFSGEIAWGGGLAAGGPFATSVA